MLKKFDEIMIRLNEAIASSRKPWIINSYGLIREFGIYSLTLPFTISRIKCKKKNKFFIYSQARTGSTLLVYLLNSHPLIHCDREIFTFRTLFTESFIKARRMLYSGRIYGCKIIESQLQRQVTQNGMAQFMRKMHAQEWKIIYLSRKNVLRHALSKLLVTHRGKEKRHQFAKNAPFHLEKIDIDINKLHSVMSGIQETNARDEEVLNGIPHLKIAYEDDLLRSDLHQKTSDRIFEYLGLNSSPVKTDLVRITSDNLSDFVANYEELKTFIHKTPYTKFL